MISFMTGPKTEIVHLFAIDADGFLGRHIATVKATGGESDKEIVQAYRQKKRAVKGSIAILCDQSIHVLLQGRGKTCTVWAIDEAGKSVLPSPPYLTGERIIEARKRQKRIRAENAAFLAGRKVEKTKRAEMRVAARVAKKRDQEIRMANEAAAIFFLDIDEFGRLTVKYGQTASLRVKTVLGSMKDLTSFMREKAAAVGLAMGDLRISPSSSLDFPEEYTDDQDVIDLCDEIRGRVVGGVSVLADEIGTVEETLRHIVK